MVASTPLKVHKIFSMFLLLLVALLVSYFEARAFRGLIVLTSDTLYMHDLINNLKQGGSIFDWNLTQAPDYFPSLFVYFLLSFFTSNALIQLFFMTVFQVFALLVIFFLIFFEFSKKKYLSFFQAISLLTLINLFQLYSQEWLYFYTTNNHFSSIILGLLVLYLILRASKSPSQYSKNFFIKLFCVIFLGTISTITFVYAVTIPVFFVLASQLAKTQGSLALPRPTKHIFHLTLSTIGATFLASTGSLVSSGSQGLVNRLNFSANEFEIIRSLAIKSLTRNLVSSGYVVGWTTFLCLFLLLFNLLIFVFIRPVFIESLSPNSPFLIVLKFSVFSLLSSIALTSISGGLVDEFFLRYFWLAIFLNLICGVMFLQLLFERFGKKFLEVKKIGVISVILLLVFYTILQKPASSKGEPYENTAKCLSVLKSSGVNLQAGVTDYWYGRSIDYLLKNKNRNYVAFNNLVPFYWMTSRDFYNDSLKYNYVLLHTSPDAFNFNFESMKDLLPVPSKTFGCNGSDISILYYSDDSLTDIVNPVKKYFFNY